MRYVVVVAADYSLMPNDPKSMGVRPVLCFVDNEVEAAKLKHKYVCTGQLAIIIIMQREVTGPK
jgi:hypothetical protein